MTNFVPNKTFVLVEYNCKCFCGGELIGFDILLNVGLKERLFKDCNLELDFQKGRIRESWTQNEIRIE